MTTTRKPATPLTAVQQFYSTLAPSDAIKLAMADHRAYCDPMMPQSDFLKALDKALERSNAYPRLVAALREVVRNQPDISTKYRALLAELGE